jgi:hypothetical protein
MLDVKPAMETDLTLNEAEDKLKQMRAEAGLTHVQWLEKPLVDRGFISQQPIGSNRSNDIKSYKRSHTDRK